MRVIDWLFRNRKTGEITIAQAPNVSLAVFIAAFVVRAVTGRHTQVHRVAADVAVVALLVWSLDEIGRGVNPWRRLLGAAVLVLEVTALAWR